MCRSVEPVDVAVARSRLPLADCREIGPPSPPTSPASTPARLFSNTLVHNDALENHRKRVRKVYYRYPHYVDGTLYFKRFRLGDDTDVALIRDWHLHLAIIPLLELYALLTDEGITRRLTHNLARGWQET
ncbi:hypothetical protein PIB30_020755 [Stylosanthes scabra]|uniref:Uncharacterized protein n=1 Tax=Stylosanthes scabra TaxID=79078 RepID=A0ABU6Z647_9FABA|nr:hypothetical protein [Stylosanthes scabra]